MDSSEFRKHLVSELIPFWNRLKDDAYGGFYGFVDHDAQIKKDSIKGVILNSRILWFYSKAYMLLKDKELLKMAAHAYSFLIEHCLDSQYGGVYWSLHYDGRPMDTEKHTYNQAFAIYALSTYYQASGDKSALQHACGLYLMVEEKCRDKEGYLEAFNRDFTPASNEKLSENGVMAERTMNTLLHVLEAYTELYRAQRASQVGDSIRWILNVFRNKVYNQERQIFEVFFDKDYNSLIDLESYGHDIEASWLIDRACEVLGDEDYRNKMADMIAKLAETVYKNAYDKTLHALNNECEKGCVDKQKIWWVQAEAVVGFYNAAYQMNFGRTKYKRAAEDIWSFISEYMIDGKSGEWYESLGEDNLPRPGQALVHPWKCPYHNGRMCMEMIGRMSER